MPTTPYISKVNIGTLTYNIKDQWARDQIGNIGSPMHFKGVSLQKITDGGTQNPTKTSGNLTSAEISASIPGASGYATAPVHQGDVYLQKSGEGQGEYVWTGTVWELLGDEGSYVTRGTYAVTLTPTSSKVTSTTSYKPAGTITVTSTPTQLSVAGTYDKATGVTTTPTQLSVSTSYTPAGTVSKPTFSGTQATITSEGEFLLPVGVNGVPTFTGTTETLSSTVSYRPAGSISLTGRETDTVVKEIVPSGSTALTSATVTDEVLSFNTGTFLDSNTTANTISVISALSGATFSGTTATLTATVSYQPKGTISAPSFNYSTDTFITVPIEVSASYTPAGTVSQPTFSGTKATITSTGTYDKANGITTNGTTITSTGTYEKVTGATFNGTTATITVTSTGNFISGVTGSVTL